ncbi:MAG: AsmA-like C-terminal region-containing protein [Planctomycetota bacterium]
MKPLADTLWTLVRWALPLSVAAVVVAAALGSQRIGEEVRRRVEARLRDRFPELVVTVRSASLVEGEGILVRGVSLSAGGSGDGSGNGSAGPPTRPMLAIDEVDIACGTTLAELATGEPRITAIRLRRPVVQASRDATGRWNVAELLAARGAGPGIPVDVEDATLAVDDATAGRRFLLRNVSLELRPEAAPAAVARTVLRGRVAGDLFDHADLEGHLDATGCFAIGGRIAALDLSPRLRGLLPAAAPLADHLAGLRGRIDLAWTIAGSLGALEAAAFTVNGSLESGHYEHASLPQAITDIQAMFTADRSGIACERLEGHSGSTLLRASGRMAGWSTDADLDLDLEAERLIVGRHWEPFLPASLASHWSKLLPAGEVDLRTRIVRRAGVVTPELAVRCRNVSLTYYRFPYRVDRTVGTVTYEAGTVKMHLTGLAGGQPVHVEGTLDAATPGVPGRVEVRGEAMRIDESLLAALPARQAEIVRTLRATGTVDFAFQHDRDPRVERGFVNTLGIRLNRCTMAYAGFPYPLSNVTGSIRMEGRRWTIRDVTGTNDTGVVRCTGSLEPDAAGGDELTLHLTGTGVVLEPELRDALPSGMCRIWDDVEPRGTAEFTARVRHRVGERRTEVELDATPVGETVSIEPAWFPYRLERLRGRLSWREGVLRFEGIRGVHARTTVSAEGRCRFTPDGGWHVSFERLTADRFRADHDVLVALPAGLQEAVAGVRLKGLLSVDGALDIYTTAPREVTLAGGRTELVPGPAAAAWDMQLDMEQAALDVGVPLEHVHGGIRLRGTSDGGTWRSLGEIAIDSATWRGLQLTGVRGPLVIDPGGARFGAAAATGDGGPRRLSGRVGGGTMQIDGSVAAGDGGRFTVAVALADADLGRLGADLSGGPTSARGRVHGVVEVSGSRAGTHSLTGRGQLRLRDADLYELPVIVALLKILRVKAPDRTAFESSTVDFRIEGPRAYLDAIELSGDAISLVGAGEVDLDSNIDLTFRPIMGKSETQLPAMKRLLGGASGQFLLVHVDGTLGEPVTSTEAFPTLPAAVQKLQAQRGQPPAARAAMRAEPQR